MQREIGRVERINYPSLWTNYPNVTPSVTGGSVYNNNMPIYAFDVPYVSRQSRADGDFIADPARYGKPRLCAYSCGRPSQVDLIKSVANINSARHG
jgi:hypothetical protein